MRPDRRPVHRLPVLRQEVNFPHPALRQPPRRGDLCSVIRCLRSRDRVPLFPYRKFRADCSKTGDEVCKKWRAENLTGALKFFCPPFIMKLQSKIGSCKEVFRTRAATITRLARQSVSDENLKHFLLWQHRAIAPARFGGSFPPILRFSNLGLTKNLSPNLLAELCGAAIRKTAGEQLLSGCFVCVGCGVRGCWCSP